MDLYRTLRVSLYLLAGTGAFAIAVAERSFFYLALIAVLGALSYLTIDRNKIKPLSAEITAGMTLVLLYLALRPLHDDEHWQAHFPAAVAHFLCAWQGLLFFSVYGGPILLTYCGSTLAVLVMSGVVQSGPSLVARVGCFLMVAVWTLYIHAVWRSRQEFAGLPTLFQATTSSKFGGTGERSDSEDLKRLPEGVFWSTLGLVVGMTVACIALGVAVFFSAPRIDGFLFEKRVAEGSEQSKSVLPPIGREQNGPASTAGFDERVSIRNLGRIQEDSQVALTATFSKPIVQITGNKGRVLLKGLSFSEYQGGSWKTEPTRETLESKLGAPIAPRDGSLDGSVFHGEEFEQSIEVSALGSPVYFAAGPVLRVKSRSLAVDAEGSLRNPGGANLERYSLTTSIPFDADLLTSRSVAEHAQLQRYVRQNGLSPNDREAIGQLARRITKRLNNHTEMARAIQRWLVTNRSYTTNLERMNKQGDPVVNFLLSAEPEQQRGHCGLFASAFVLLCRANDMPTRLCTGYAAHADASDPLSKIAIANNSDAHAWAEIYFKGIGWVRYDPTPPESASTVASAPIIAPRPTTQPQTSTSVDAPEKEPSNGLVQDWWDRTLNYNGYEQRKLFEKLSGSSGTSGSAFSGKGWGGFGVALAWVGIAVAIGWLVQVFARRNVRRKYALAPGAQRSRAAVAFYNDLLNALSRRGYSRRPGQTPREFAESVMRRGGEAFAPVREVTDIFEAVRYGGGELKQEEFNRLQDALDKIREMTF